MLRSEFAFPKSPKNKKKFLKSDVGFAKKRDGKWADGGNEPFSTYCTSASNKINGRIDHQFTVITEFCNWNMMRDEKIEMAIYKISCNTCNYSLKHLISHWCKLFIDRINEQYNDE